MSGRVERVTAAPTLPALDSRFISAVVAAVGDSAGDDAALGQDVRALTDAFAAREAELTRGDSR